MACPLIEVFNVAVFVPESSMPCYVYGDIFVYDDYGPDEQIHQLYERDSEHPELISESGQFLLITGPGVPLSMPKPVISIRLLCKGSDSDEDLIISVGERRLETARDEFEEFKCCEFEGVTVYYAAMARGLVADVAFHLLPAGVDICSKDSGHNLSGTITAYYSPKYSYHVRNDDDKHEFPKRSFKTTLMKINPTDSSLVRRNKNGNPYLWLSKRLVAVPAYSSLIIEANIIDTVTKEPFLKGTLTKLAVTWSATPLIANADAIDSPNVSLRVVEWSEPAELQPRSKFNLSHRFAGNSLGEPLVEVYSIFVSHYGHKNVDMLSIYGKITVRPTQIFTNYPIYKRERGDAEFFPKGVAMGRLSLTGPSCPLTILSSDDHFAMSVDLADAQHEDFSVQGTVRYDSDSDEDEKLYDKLLCSVIHGRGIHCVVHYTNFSRAVRLKLTCSVVSKYCADAARVHGTIVARCDDLDYTFDYHRKYCKRVLFDKSGDEGMLLFQNVASEINQESSSLQCNQENISTSYVAMPVGGTLSIDVNVYASSHHGGGPAEHLKGTVKYNMLGDPAMVIEGEEFDILVSGLVFDAYGRPLDSKIKMLS